MKKNIYFIIVMLFLVAGGSYGQIGIGTTTPNPSSILDITSTEQGLLAPRMTTVERTAIASPANGLLVFDTTEGAFYYYNLPTIQWVKMPGDKRLNYKLIKSTDVLATVLAPELAAGGGVKYLMDTSTLYEINGTINLNLPIEINNAYITGLDANEDKLVNATGDVFNGMTGGSVRFLTLTASAGKVFDITGTGSIASGTQTQTMLVRDCIIANSANVGKIENMALSFASIIQYVGNSNGIIYKDISRLLISNTAWFGNNSGTYETLQGTFNLVTKQGGFSEVNGAKIGFDVSSNPIITSDATLEGTVFTGVLTTGKYINGYNPAPYSGFNFNNSWEALAPGINTEGDDQATGTVYLDRNGTLQATTSIGTLGVNAKLNITAGLTDNLYRCSATTNNRITYQGKKGRIFQANAAVSFSQISGTGNTEYAFFFMRIPAAGGTVPQVASETLIDTNAGYIQAFPIQGAVYLEPGDSVELWIRRLNSNSQTFRVRSFNMTIQ